MNRIVALRDLARLIPGMCMIIALAAGIGLAFNGLNPNGLPLIRKPLRETRHFVTASELLSHSSSQSTMGNKSSASVQAAKDAVANPVLKKSPALESAQKSVPNIEQEPAMIADPRKVTPIPTVVQTKEPAPDTPNKTRMTAPDTDLDVKESPQQPKKTAQALFTTLDDAKALFDKKAAIFLDGRPVVDYEADHIQGAMSLFTEEVDNLYEKVLEGVPKDKVIITYCSDPECTEAIKLADALVVKGYTNVVILLEGLPGWKEAGYPTDKAKDAK